MSDCEDPICAHRRPRGKQGANRGMAVRFGLGFAALESVPPVMSGAEPPPSTCGQSGRWERSKVRAGSVVRD